MGSTSLTCLVLEHEVWALTFLSCLRASTLTSLSFYIFPKLLEEAGRHPVGTWSTDERMAEPLSQLSLGWHHVLL